MLSKSATQTKEVAKSLTKGLTKPTVLALQGTLGTGKTTFVQGIAEELGITKRVLSPTFVFLRSYKLNDPRFKYFHHFDLYRAGSLADAKSIGLEERIKEGNSLTVIEWPEIARQLLPKETQWINFKKISGEQREIEIS